MATKGRPRKIDVMSNREYCAAIDKFIPLAEIEAQERVDRLGKQFDLRPGADGKPRRHDYFTEFFHEIVNQRARAAGLRVT